MKRIEKVLAVSIIITVLLSLIPWGGMLFLSVWLTIALCILYLLFSFLLFNGIKLRHIFNSNSYEKVPPSQIFTAMATGLVLAFTCFAIIFKLFSWPYSPALLLAAIALLSAILIIALINQRKQPSLFHKRIITRTAFFLSVSVALVSVNEIFFMEVQYRHYPAYMNAVKQAAARPSDKDLNDKLIEEREKMKKDYFK